MDGSIQFRVNGNIKRYPYIWLTTIVCQTAEKWITEKNNKKDAFYFMIKTFTKFVELKIFPIIFHTLFKPIVFHSKNKTLKNQKSPFEEEVQHTSNCKFEVSSAFAYEWKDNFLVFWFIKKKVLRETRKTYWKV